jgi:predicted RNase H-like HicB family nuclease
MKVYHVLVEQDEKWFVGRVLEREGITTQGRSLDELLFMVRDAIKLMWDEREVELEMIVPAAARTAYERSKSRAPRKRVRGGAARWKSPSRTRG